MKTIIVALSLLSTICLAKVERKYQMPRLLRYHELMELTREQRAEYIKGIVQMLSELEALHPQKQASQNFILELNFLNKALADDIPHLDVKYPEKPDPDAEEGEEESPKPKREKKGTPKGGKPESKYSEQDVEQEESEQQKSKKAQEGPFYCLPPECHSEEGDAAKKRKFMDTGEVNCINGGMIADFNYDTGKCPIVKSLTLGSETYTCDQPRYTLCNPLVFPMDGDHCVPIGRTTTRMCNEKTNSKLLDEELKKKNPADWNKFTADIERLCVTNEASADYHCHECKIILNNIRKIAKRIDKTDPCVTPWGRGHVTKDRKKKPSVDEPAPTPNGQGGNNAL